MRSFLPVIPFSELFPKSQLKPFIDPSTSVWNAFFLWVTVETTFTLEACVAWLRNPPVSGPGLVSSPAMSPTFLGVLCFYFRLSCLKVAEWLSCLTASSKIRNIMAERENSIEGSSLFNPGNLPQKFPAGFPLHPIGHNWITRPFLASGKTRNMNL